ncbi:HEAT repeat domain-containing protein [Erythrobacter sp. SDW2]|uniref:HEAT repeat domain-containing protein n=1 Tax=Erythrobacter sp. SDW2 TaxID=2907154 RepID=UPI001F20286F|nr:HEAT repeat domain-containing protein [Erythrobacter sp. SDW2]UIP07810.1 HEAT repeat domain-containing protein [Erythrobacter sp. SDW2]
MDPVALIIEATAISATAIIVFFIALLYRRWRLERIEARHRVMLAAITRSYLQRVSGQPVSTEGSWPVKVKLAAVSHLHLLLRGGERDRLMQMAELDGLLEATIRQSKRIRAAQRIEAVRMLQQFGSEACIARLRQMLVKDPNATVQMEAAFALASMRALPPPRELIRILGMFDRKPTKLDQALLRACAEMYCDHLLQILDDPMPHWRRAGIVEALGWADNPDVLAVLARAAATDSPELRSAALRAAAKIGHPSVAHWVIELLDDPTPFVRVQAANCCASLGLSDAVPKLEELLGDPELWVRLRAEHALDVLVRHYPSDETFGEVA